LSRFTGHLPIGLWVGLNPNLIIDGFYKALLQPGYFSVVCTETPSEQALVLLKPAVGTVAKTL
jgi:hypothetical protein